MNIVFFGSAKFAAPSLKALITGGHKISCIVTQPDRQRDRGLHLEGTPVKAVASESGIQIYQPEDINSNEAIKFLKGLKPDLFIVISYGQILSRSVLDIPKIFAINAHASLLPKYRGAAPINWAIIRGEKNSGVSIIKMTEKMDAGSIIAQKLINIENEDTAVTLEGKLSLLAAKTLLDTLEPIKTNNYNLINQVENMVSFAPKLKKEDGLINWNKPACEICNLIRAVLDWPGAFTYYKGKLLKIYKAKVVPLAPLPRAESRGCPVSPLAGKIAEVSKEGIVINTEKDNLMIQELQLEGKRKMRVEEFIAGHKIRPGDSLG